MTSFTAGTSYRKHDAAKNWYVIDAANLVLGRLASEVAILLRGKHKADFTPHLNSGDHVVIVNAEKVALTGKKADQDKFYWHTNHPGGIKERTKGQLRDGKYPARLIKKAIERMMPKDSSLADDQMANNLHIYAGPEHKHAAQQPVVLDLATKNRKNKRSA
jgi:large subunit ribosomal protein L13